MRFSGELELHDGIGRPESVGEFLQYRQKVRRFPAAATGPAQAPADRTAPRAVLWGSSGRAAGDWGVSCRGEPGSMVSLPIKSHLMALNGTGPLPARSG